MNNYRRPIRRNRFRESLSWAERINFKSKGLEIFYIDTLTRIGANPNDPDDFSDWIKTGYLIDATSLSDRDAIYFAKGALCEEMLDYNTYTIANTQKWSDEAIFTLGNVRGDLGRVFNRVYGSFEERVIKGYNDDMRHLDSGDYYTDLYQEEIDEWFCKKVREQGVSMEINSKYADDVGKVSFFFNDDPYDEKEDIAKWVTYGIELNYNLMNQTFAKIPMNESYRRKGSRLY
jgi:hypothetical protein